MTAYSIMARAARKSIIICAIVLSLFMAGGMVLSLIAIEKAFFDFMLAFRWSPSPFLSDESLVEPSSSSSPSNFSISPPRSLKRPAFWLLSSSHPLRGPSTLIKVWTSLPASYLFCNIFINLSISFFRKSLPNPSPATSILLKSMPTPPSNYF